MEQLTLFKIRIDKIMETHIGFEMFVGDHFKDGFMNIVAKDGYGIKKRLALSPKQFSELAVRLIAYVYTEKSEFSDSELKTLWSLKINIFNHEAQKLSKSIFQIKSIRKQLYKLNLIKQS